MSLERFGIVTNIYELFSMQKQSLNTSQKWSSVPVKLGKKNLFLCKETSLLHHLSSSDFSWPETFKIIYLIKPLGEALSWCMFGFEASLLVTYSEPN